MQSQAKGRREPEKNRPTLALFPVAAARGAASKINIPKGLRKSMSDTPGATAIGASLIQRMMQRRPAVAELIGFEVPEAGDGRAVVTLQAGPRHYNPMGTLHGGILCDIADAAMGIAFASTLGAGESFTTVELKINFFRPVWEAALRAESRVVRRGRTIGYVECDVTDEKGKLIAKSNSTCLVLRGEQATGR
jgi:uncharacterized protein (TIGR00369 family)